MTTPVNHQNKNKTPPPPHIEMIELKQFFKFVHGWDKVLMVIGTISAVITGLLLPSLAIVMGEVTNTFDPDNTAEQIKDQMSILAGYISLVGLGTWLFGYVFYSFWQHLAENISFDLRSKFLHSILKQEVAFFEKQNVEQLPSQIGENFSIIQDAIGEKFSGIIFTTFTLISGIGIAFYRGADFAAICFAYFPFIMVIITLFGAQVKKAAIRKVMVSKKMGGVVEESFGAIRLIMSFAQEERELKKFQQLADETRQIAHSSEYWLAGFIGFFRLSIFGFYCFSFWIATIYIDHKMVNPNTGHQYSVGELLSVLVSLMTGMTMLFGLNPNVQALIRAKVVGRMVFEVIDRTPLIWDNDVAIKEFEVKEKIRFEKVTFKYPTAQENIKNVLEGASFEIKAGQTTAIVGPSGSGKSTIIQMIERFYDPKEGNIYFDNVNLKDIKLRILRESIGYVSQEPVLILGTIRDNLLFGNKDAKEEDIERCLKLANATFVYDMENKLDSYVGSSSVMNLSGGQKQRIAIARALIKNPQILILDEATSALDPKSEKEVQDAIDEISHKDSRLTIIMIAHRLQTIMTAQNLLYLEAKNSVVPATKGTAEYDVIMNRLQEQNYAHQKDDPDSPNKSPTDKVSKRVLKDKSVPRMMTDKSDGNQDPELAENDQDVREPKPVGMLKIMAFYSPKWLAYITYVLTIINSFGFPIYGLVFSKILFIMLVPQLPTFTQDRNLWCGLFILLAFAIAFFGYLNKITYAFLGENLTFTIRTKLFESILHKHLGWFDNKDRAPGILSNVLSQDITLLNGLTTETIANILEASLCLIVGCILAFVFTWKMALVTLATCPFVILGGIVMSRLQWSKNKQQGGLKEKGYQDPYQRANALLSDMIMNYRTVISFGQKNIDFVMTKYDKLLEEPNSIGVRNAHIAGFFYGYSQCIRFLFLAFIFYISSIFIYDYKDRSDDTYIGVYILFVAALGSGIAISQAPSVSKARVAAGKVFDIIEEESKIDTRTGKGEKLIKSGEIELLDVEFKYPSRTQKVLKKMNMKIPSTKKIALVGHSGCGKSTIANLLLRMYDVNGGSLMIDGIDIRDYDIKALRQQIGIVMQEPLLFNMSIKDNIRYGNEKASDQRVREVAEMANALQFIESNIEDLSKEDVKEAIEKGFKEYINDEKVMKDYPNFQILSKKYFDEKVFNIDELLLIDEVLKKADADLRLKVNKNLDRFINVLQESSKLKGIKWDDIVLRFEWSFEADKIEEYLNSAKVADVKDIYKNPVKNALKNFKTKFDLKTIKDYLEQVVLQEKPEDTEFILQNFIKASFDRLKEQNNYRIKSLHQSNTNDSDFQLHEGFNKICGLKGALLSGGQKQRVAIARALIKDPKILILDEATSALDEQSQELVQQALDRAMEGRTSVVIAHRLSTIRNCEWLFVIHKGKVAEQGTYEELSNNPNSYFYKLKSGMEM